MSRKSLEFYASGGGIEAKTIAGVLCEWRWHRGENDRWTLSRKSDREQVAEVVQYVYEGELQRDRGSGKILRAVFLEGEERPFCTDPYVGGAKWQAEQELARRWSLPTP